MKKIVLLLLVLLVFPSVLAINLQVEKVSSEEVLIIGISKSTLFDLKITNNESADNFEFYNLLGFSMFPVGTVPINGGETKEIVLGISPLGRTDARGFYNFEYYIRASDGAEQKETIMFQIMDVKDAIIINSGDVDPESNEIEISLKNRVNFDFGDVNAKFSSLFFDLEENFSLGPKEIKNFTIQLNNEDFRRLIAGFYTINAEIKIEDHVSEIEGIVKFVEKDLVTTTKKEFGIFVNTNIIEKKNEGNTIEHSETVIKKNIISRLFTSFSPDPDIVEREGATVYYTWIADVGPGETYEISVRTNWFFPLLIIIFIVAIVIFVKKYSGTDVILKKKVSFVKAKGGEFALKVSILVQAQKYVERVNIVDRLPALVKIYERFGGDRPDRIDEKNRRLEWNFEKLEQGERRVLSYIIYSKIGVVGKFALPQATAVFEREGKIKEVDSNRTFFVAEQRGGED